MTVFKNAKLNGEITDIICESGIITDIKRPIQEVLTLKVRQFVQVL